MAGVAAGKLGVITFEMDDMLILGDLREFMRRVEAMPDDAEVIMHGKSYDEPEMGGGVKATWRTTNPL